MEKFLQNLYQNLADKGLITILFIMEQPNNYLPVQSQQKKHYKKV